MGETLPQLLVAHAARHGDRRIALREKEFGIWQSVTWRQYLDHVQHFCLGLIALGLQPQETVAIIGDNRPEWIYAELAAQAAGAKAVGIYQDSVAAEVQYIAAIADATFLVVEDQEQVDKVLEIAPRLPNVRKIVYYDPRGLRAYDQPLLIDFAAVEALGQAYAVDHPDLFTARVAQGRASDLAILSTTSGTTAEPKLAMLTHANLLSQARHLMAVDPIPPEANFVSFLPLAWIGEQMIAVSCGLHMGFTLNFPEEPETVRENIREIGPQVMFSPPRIWENLLSAVQVKIADTTRFKRAVYTWALGVGYQMADARFTGKRPPAWLRLRYRLADWTVFQLLKDQLGLRHLRRCYTGGAALGPDVFRFYHALGVNLKQVYGQTEVSGLAVIHRDGAVKFQSVGQPLPETEVQIAADGEILVRSGAVFQGYYSNPAATAAALVGGWLHTGDAGYFDGDGQLVVIDRAKDVMTLPDGTRFSPQFIENKLKFSQYIKEAVVFGGDQPFVTAMINIDMGNVGKWAESNRVAYTTYADLAQKPAVYALIGQDVARTNADLPASARIRRFVLLHKELDADDAELTRTRKVRRRYVAERYAYVVAALYGAADALAVEMTVSYQDGTTATIQTQLKIEAMAE